MEEYKKMALEKELKKLSGNKRDGNIQIEEEADPSLMLMDNLEQYMRAKGSNDSDHEQDLEGRRRFEDNEDLISRNKHLQKTPSQDMFYQNKDESE